MAKVWHGDVWIGAAAAYFVGSADDNELHAHYALQVCIALRGSFSVRDDDGRSHDVHGILIPSGKRHCVSNPTKATADTFMLFVEPNSDLGRLLFDAFPGLQQEMVPIDADRLATMRHRLDALLIEGGDRLVREMVSILTGGAWRHRAMDRRVAMALHHIDSHLHEPDGLEHVANRLGISSRYLRKLFEQEIGLSPQRYRQWSKLRQALASIVAGASFTDGAAAGGFTDSAHFSRTFRDMFGAPPSMIFESSARRAQHFRAPSSDI
ncbi:AraC family transcriptional regulator [Ahniella affigens]|nr:AraC family transcriptional regulator [Ahniella affigens]